MEEIAQLHLEAEVRIETYDSNNKRASTMNGISKVIVHVTSEKITIVSCISVDNVRITNFHVELDVPEGTTRQFKYFDIADLLNRHSISN